MLIVFMPTLDAINLLIKHNNTILGSKADDEITHRFELWQIGVLTSVRWLKGKRSLV